VKQEIIIEAAIKRFSHFGINKTTLTEIADDLALTKQSLGYYFHDKQSLIAAVEERITSEYIKMLEEATKNQESTEAALLNLVEVRMRFFEKYYMLAQQVHNGEPIFAGRIATIKFDLREKELNLLTRLLESGISKGELNPMNVVKTSTLLLDTLQALSHCVREKAFMPEADDFKEMLRRQEDVISLFYNGLKNQVWSN
jgi:TetR/AcrR family transcriptional regulator